MPDMMKPYPMGTAHQKRDAYLKRYSRLDADRSSWITHWSDVGRHILPRVARFFSTDRNRGGRERYGSILDNTATRAARVLSAGLMAGMTSPARPWFRLTTQDPALRDIHSVQVWLDMVKDRMQAVFGRSNVYRSLQQTYDELGVFGTSAMLVLSDRETVIRIYPLTVGEYCLQQDYQGRIVSVYREYERTVGEVVKEFGYDNCSNRVQQQFDRREHESTVKILHVIEPRADQERFPNSKRADHMPWASIHMELDGETDTILRESGFRRMRVLAPRWQVHGGDVYGVSPGMEALGDIRQLQQEQLRKSQAIDYKVRPPLQVPQSVKDRERDSLPGGVSLYEPGGTLPFDQTTPHGGIRSAFQVDLQLDHLLVDIQDVRMRIKQSFFEDLFLMLSHADNGRMTATEVLERQEEKLLMIGPVVERMTNELLEPLIDITFQEMLEVGALPPPPEELLGHELSVEFVSILAQAQRAVGVTSVQRFVSDALSVSEARPDVLDNINFDEWLRRTAHMRGVEASMLVDEASVLELRQARARAQAAQEQTVMAREQASTVKDLAQSPVNEGNALAELFGRAGTAGTAA